VGGIRRKGTHGDVLAVTSCSADMATNQTNGTAARKDIEFYGGASRFELELEVSPFV
jgi:hypothetical protein